MITNSRLGENLCVFINIESSQKIELSTSDNTNNTINTTNTYNQGRPSGQKSTSATSGNQAFLLRGAESMP